MKNKISKNFFKNKKKLHQISDDLENADIIEANLNKEIPKKITLGTIYRQKRLDSGIDIIKASNFLKVRLFDLNAIENDEINKINKNIYAIGLIRSYGKFLKIDEKLIEEKIKELSFRSNIDNKKHILVNIGEHLELTPKKELLYNTSLIAFFLILIIFVISSIYSKKIIIFKTSDILNEIAKIEK